MTLGNKEVLSRNLRNCIVRSGKDRSEIAKDLGFPYSTLTDWVNGRKYPRIDNIEKLARYFKVSKSELIEDLKEGQVDNEILAAIVIQLRVNKTLLNVVKKLMVMDKAKLESLNRLLDTFL